VVGEQDTIEVKIKEKGNWGDYACNTAKVVQDK